jgi:hypothetical protein
MFSTFTNMLCICVVLAGKRFATVDRMWRKTTDGAKRNPLVLKVCLQGCPPDQG